MGELNRLLVKCVYSLLDKACQRFGAGLKLFTGEIVHRGLRYKLMPVSMLISAAVPFCLLLKGEDFTSDKAYGRAAISQGDVGTRWKSTV